MSIFRSGISATLAGALWLASPASSAQISVGITTLQRAGEFRSIVGKPLTFICPASDGAKAVIYGTDEYHDDSPICAAAIHAGVLKPRRAGLVTIVVREGGKSFQGSERNGIVSLDYRGGAYSFVFTRGGEPGNINWRTRWGQVPTDLGEPVTVTCPPAGSTDAPVWGTDLYQTDSAICVAAVHAGVITAEKGGIVAARWMPGPAREFTATDRFKVSSRKWSAQPDAFSVAAATASGGGSPPPPPPAAIAPRTIQLAGFTAVGIPQASVAPRTIQLAGFTAMGIPQASAAPRTIQLAGFTAVGVAPPPAAAGSAPRTVQLVGFTVVGVSPANSPASTQPRTVAIPGWAFVGTSGHSRGDQI